VASPTSWPIIYMSYEDVLLFGQLGNGDMVFQPLVPHGNENVFRWDHEDDSRTWYAAMSSGRSFV
jgi:hypothetical protein